MSKANQRSLRRFFIFSLVGATVLFSVTVGGSRVDAFGLRAVVQQDPEFLAVIFDGNVSSTVATSSMITMSTGTVLSVMVPSDMPNVLFVSASGTVGVGQTVTASNALRDTGNVPLSTTTLDPTTTRTVLHGVKIASVRAGTANNNLDEYVTLYNATMNPITASGTLYLHSIRGGAGSADKVIPLTFSTSSIKGRGFFLIASGPGYGGSVSPDAVYSTSTDFIQTSTTTLLLSTTSTIDVATAVIDKVEWASSAQFTTSTGTGSSNSTSTWAPTVAAVTLPADMVLVRKALNTSASSTMKSGGADSNKGNGYDTRSNSADFVVLDPSAGQNAIIKNSQSPTEFPYGGGQSDTTAPTVRGSFPGGMAGEMVPTDLQFIGFDFSKPVDPSTVTSSTVSLVVQGQNTNLCTTINYVTGNMPPARCTLSGSLTAGTTYLFTVKGASSTPNVKDFSNNALSQPAGTSTGQFGTATKDYQISFSPSSGLTYTPSVPPQVMSVSPSAGQSGVPTNVSKVSITFSTTMSSSTFGGVTLVTGSGSNLLTNASAALSSDGKTVTIPISSSLTSGSTYTLTVPTSVQNSNNVSLSSQYTSVFVAGSSADSTGPLIMGRLPNVATGISVNAIDIHATTDDALDPSSISTTTVQVTDGSSNVIPGTVTYNPMMREILWVGNNVFLPSTQYTVSINATGTATAVQNTSGLKLQDSDGSANGKYQFSFTTAASSDGVGPTVVFANANTFSVAVTFDEAVKENDAETLANYSLTSAGSSVSLSALNGHTVVYDPAYRTATIKGLSLTSGNSFNITVSYVKDLSNNSIQTASASAGGTVQSSSNYGGNVGPGAGYVPPTGGDAPTGFSTSTFGFVPQPEVRPFNTLAGFTSTYGVGLPIATQIPASGKITLVFPSAFTVAGAKADTFSPANSDINGPGTGAVTIASVVGNDTAHTVTVTLGSTATRSDSGDTHDFLRFDLGGIINPPTPSSNYTVDFRTGSATTTLESATSRPFAITGGGSNTGSLTVSVAASGATNGTTTIYLFSSQTGPMATSTTAFASGAATTTFANLPAGQYNIMTDPIVTLTGGTFLGQATPKLISVSGSATTSITLSSTGSSASSTVTVYSDAAGRKIDIFAGGPQGFVAIATTTINGTSTVTIFYPSNGNYTVGVGPQMPKTFSGQPPSPDYVMPQPVQVSVASGVASRPTVAFSLAAAGNTIAGFVKDASSKVIANANVFAYSPTGGFGTFGQSGSDGAFRLSVAAGSYKIGASSPGFPPAQDMSVLVNASGHVFVNGATASTTSVVIKLVKPSTKISGSVTDGSNPVSGAQVWAYCDPSISNNACFGPNGHASAQTDSAGAYTLYVGSGTWKVSAFIPGYGQQPEVSVTMSGSDQTLSDFRPSATGSFNSVSGTACTHTAANCTGGTGVSGVMIRIEGTDPNGKFYSNSTVSGSDGTYSFSSVPSGAGSSYRVRGFSSTLGEFALTAAFTVTGNVTSKDLVVKAGRTVSVKVSGAPSSYDAMMGFFNTTTGIGNFIGLKNTATSTVQLPNGSVYKIDVRSPGFSLGPSSLALTSGTATYSTSTGQLDLTSGSDTIALTVTWPSTTALSGTVKDASLNAIANAWVDVNDSSTGLHFGTQANSSGAYSLSLADGSYMVTAYSPGYVPNSKSLVLSSGTITLGNSTTTASTVNLTVTKTSLAITGTVKANGTAAPNSLVKGALQGGGVSVVLAGADGTYSLPVSAGTWELSAVADGYQAASYGTAITITTASVANIDINATTTVSRSAPTVQSIVPTEGGTIRDSGGNVEIRVPANALGSSASTGQIKATETSAVMATATAKPVGNGQDLRAYDSSSNAVTSFNDNVDISITVASSTFASNSLTSTSTAEKLKLGYFDSSLGDWVPIASSLTYENASDVQVTPDATLSNVDHITLTGKTSHFTVFGAIVATDSVAPAAPSGISATSNGASAPTVSWTAPTTNSDATSLTDLMEYEIYRDTDSSGSFSTQVNSSQVASSTTSFTDSSAATGVTYYYKVTAADSSGNESSKSSASGGVIRSASSVTTAGAGPSGGGGGAPVTTSTSTISTATSTTATTPSVASASATTGVPTVSATDQGRGALSGVSVGFKFAKRLTQGLKNNDVRNLQQVLAQVLKLKEGDIVTGYFGKMTKKAVQDFQEKYGIAQPGDAGYGDVGPKTQTKLNELLKGEMTPPLSSVVSQGIAAGITGVEAGFAFGRGLAAGSRGDEVKNLQRILVQTFSLNAEDYVTGYFGPLTRKAVQDFQEKYGIAQPGDAGYGDVGPATRAKLNEFLKGGSVPSNGTSGAAASPSLDSLQSRVLELTKQLQELLQKRSGM